MKEFFRSKSFKVIVVIAVLLFAFFLRGLYTGGLLPLLSDLGGAIATPVNRFFSSIGDTVEDWFEPVFHGKRLQEENKALREELDLLTDRQVDYDKLKNENELYREFLEIGDHNTEYDIEPATVIARPADSSYGSFVIDVGHYHGVEEGMPVITDHGLVGIVTQVAHSYSKVSSLLDPSVKVGVLDSASRDTGVLSGESDFAAEGRTAAKYVSRQSLMQKGDVIITSGYGGMIPSGLTVGYIEEILQDPSGLTLMAKVRPSADPGAARRVFVITDYTEKMPDAGSLTDPDADR